MLEVIGPASSRTARSPNASFPSDLPRVSVSIGGREDQEDHDERADDGDLRQRAVRMQRGHQERRSRRAAARGWTSTSISPEARRRRGCRGQVERDRLAGDEVVAGERGELAGSVIVIGA